MPRSTLTETVDRLNSLVNQILGLNEEERGYVLDQILPEPEEQPKQKKTRKKRAASATNQRRGMPTPREGNGNCVALVNDTPCDEPQSSPIHDPKGGYAGYHEFQPGKKEKVSAASGD